MRHRSVTVRAFIAKQCAAGAAEPKRRACDERRVRQMSETRIWIVLVALVRICLRQMLGGWWWVGWGMSFVGECILAGASRARNTIIDISIKFMCTCTHRASAAVSQSPDAVVLQSSRRRLCAVCARFIHTLLCDAIHNRSMYMVKYEPRQRAGADWPGKCVNGGVPVFRRRVTGASESCASASEFEMMYTKRAHWQTANTHSTKTPAHNAVAGFSCMYITDFARGISHSNSV